MTDPIRRLCIEPHALHVELEGDLKDAVVKLRLARDKLAVLFPESRRYQATPLPGIESWGWSLCEATATLIAKQLLPFLLDPDGLGCASLEEPKQHPRPWEYLEVEFLAAEREFLRMMFVDRAARQDPSGHGVLLCADAT